MVFLFLMLCYQPHQNLVALSKNIYLAHKSAIWAGFIGDSSSLLHPVSAGLTQKQGAELSEDLLTYISGG